MESFLKFRNFFFFSFQIFIKVTADGEAENNATTPGKYHHWYSTWPLPGIEFLTRCPVSFALLILLPHTCFYYAVIVVTSLTWTLATCLVFICCVMHHLSVFNPLVCGCLCLTCALSPLEQWMLLQRSNGTKIGADGKEGQRLESDSTAVFL